MFRRDSENALVAAEAAPDLPASVSAGYPDGMINVRDVVRILQRHRRLIVLVVAASVVLAIAFIAMATPLYTATATVFIDPRRASVLEPSNLVHSNFGTDDATIESQVALVQSGAVLQRVVDELNLVEDEEFLPPPGIVQGIVQSIKGLFSSPDPGISADEANKASAIRNLQKRVKVARQRATFLVDINVRSSDRSKAAKIANAIAQSYFAELVRAKAETTKTAAGWLNRQIDEMKARVLASDKAVQDFRANNNLLVTQGVTVNDQQISDLNNKLVEARTEVAEARAKYEQVDRIARERGDFGATTEALGSEMIARLRTQYADLSKNVAEMSSKYGPRHPLRVTAQAQLGATGKLIGEEIKRILEARRHNYDVAAARERSLQKSLDDLQNISSTSGQAQVRLRELQREAEANRTLYESLLARYKETAAQESLALPESRVVTDAKAPIVPSFPRTSWILAISVVIGLGFGGLLAFAIDYFDRRIKSSRQVKAISGLRALAAMPAIGARELARLAKRGRTELKHYDPRTARLLPLPLQPPLLRYALEEPASSFAEAVRGVRFALQQAARKKPVEVVMVTSATSGEGKTTLAVNLALSMAVLGVKTVLVDGDLRNPELTRSLCPNARFGVVEVSSGAMPLHQALLHEPSTNLSILPSPDQGDITLVAEFTSSVGLDGVLKDLRTHFDLVIVDAPPILPLVDGRVLAEQADSIVLTVAWDRTAQETFERGVEQLGPIYDRVVGTVLTRVDLGRYRFYEPYGEDGYGAYYPYGTPPVREAAA